MNRVKFTITNENGETVYKLGSSIEEKQVYTEEDLKEIFFCWMEKEKTEAGNWPDQSELSEIHGWQFRTDKVQISYDEEAVYEFFKSKRMSDFVIFDKNSNPWFQEAKALTLTKSTDIASKVHKLAIEKTIEYFLQNNETKIPEYEVFVACTCEEPEKKYLVVNNSKNVLIRFEEQYQLFESREDALKCYEMIGGKTSTFAVSDEAGIANITRHGKVDVMFMPIEVK